MPAIHEQPGLPGGLVAEVMALPLSKRVATLELPLEKVSIPQHYIAERAYFKFLERGSEIHGFDKEDWFEALGELRILLRELLSPPEEQRRYDFDGQTEGNVEESSSQPKTDDDTESSRDASVPDAQPLQDGRGAAASSSKEGKMTTRKEGLDVYGNYWPKRPRPIRSDMDVELFASEFAGFRVVVVHCETDEVYAAGHDEKSLRKGFEESDYQLSDFQLEPGPGPELARNGTVSSALTMRRRPT